MFWRSRCWGRRRGTSPTCACCPVARWARRKEFLFAGTSAIALSGLGTCTPPPGRAERGGGRQSSPLRCHQHTEHQIQVEIGQCPMIVGRHTGVMTTNISTSRLGLCYLVYYLSNENFQLMFVTTMMLPHSFFGFSSAHDENNWGGKHAIQNRFYSLHMKSFFSRLLWIFFYKTTRKQSREEDFCFNYPFPRRRLVILSLIRFARLEHSSLIFCSFSNLVCS